MIECIRPDIITRYRAEAERSWSERLALMAVRDDAYRMLNQEYGFTSPDGTATSSFMGSAGPDYLKRYRAIDDAFKPRYEHIAHAQEKWRKAVGLSPSEYLYLDNFHEPLMKCLCGMAGFGDFSRRRLLEAKAELYIEDWASKASAGNVYARISAEIKLFSFASRRCRAFLEIGPFNLTTNLAIRRYREDWRVAMLQEFNSRRLTAPSATSS